MINNEISQKMEPLFTGDDLLLKLEYYPEYNSEMRNQSVANRLQYLNTIYDFFYPNKTAVDIYINLYLAVSDALRLKFSNNMIKQLNNHTFQKISPLQGINGNRVFTIFGDSGLGKTRSINRAISLITNCKVLELENNIIIPVLNIQAPFDKSSKTFLLSINKAIDDILGTNHYASLLKSKASTSQMLLSTCNILNLYVGCLCVDEVEGFVQHKNGSMLIQMLTNLMNESMVSCCFIGTNSAENFFSSVPFLARRSMGLQLLPPSYDNEDYINFIKKLWKYQFTKSYTELSEGYINYIYQHTNGITALIMYLYIESQKIAILNTSEKITYDNLNSAYRRMHTMNGFIQPELELRKRTTRPQKNTSYVEVKKIDNIPVANEEWSFTELLKISKATGKNMLNLLENRISISEV